jgi:4-hydroxy-3-methylbut-2-enyl diphosphate reductase
VQAVIARLRELGATSVRRMDGVVENVRFPLPRGLGDRSMAEAGLVVGAASGSSRS